MKHRRIALVMFCTTVALTIAAPQAAGPVVVPPLVPGDLQVEGGNAAFLLGHAIGTQNYVCLPSGATFKWTLFGPQATLFDDNSNQQITHFLSANVDPADYGVLRATWQHSGDTSRVWAVAVATSTDSRYVAAGAIPWLLLRVLGRQDGPTFGHKLTQTTFIHRVNTDGGVAPGTGCTAATDVGKKVFVPYTADYIFYRP